MNRIFEIAAKIANQWSLLAFAIAGLISIVTKVKKGRVPAVVWLIVSAIVILALTPIVAPIYLDNYGIYRIRIVILDQQVPTNDAKVVCSLGGEVKKVEGGWECDIPSKTRPSSRKLQVYATVADAFLKGTAEADLGNDYSTVVTIPLVKDTSARIVGIVVDQNNVPLEGALVGVVGYDAEAITTKKGGSFSLSAHKADGQEVQLYATKDGYIFSPESHMAGEFPVTLKLRNRKKAN